MRLFLTIIPSRASKGIILLKEKEYDPLLLQYLNHDNIDRLRESVTEKYRSNATVAEDLFSKLTSITRVGNRELIYAIVLINLFNNRASTAKQTDSI